MQVLQVRNNQQKGHPPPRACRAQNKRRARQAQVAALAAFRCLHIGGDLMEKIDILIAATAVLVVLLVGLHVFKTLDQRIMNEMKEACKLECERLGMEFKYDPKGVELFSRLQKADAPIESDSHRLASQHPG